LKIDRKNKTVTYAEKDYKHGGRKTALTFSNQEFISRFSLHILPKGFTRIRHYGTLSSSWKKEKLPKLQAELRTTSLAILKPKEPLLHRRCPTCKKGKLHTIYLFNERGPPKNWKELLKDKLLTMSY